MPRRSTTPGVWVWQRKRGGRRAWYARWIEPASGRRRDVALEQLGLRNAHDRAKWAREKSEEIQRARRDHALGRHGRTALAAALDQFEADARARDLRPATIYKYRSETQSLVDWLPRHRGVRAVEEITGRDLWAYRQAALKQDAVPATLASHLCCVRVVVRFWRRAHLLPLATPEDVTAAFAGPRVDDQPPRPLAQAELRALLAAARGREPRGAGMIVTALLTGMRLGELERLRWDQVALDVPPAGIIRLGAETKTRRGRTIDLAVCPTVASLLSVLPRAGAYVFGGAAPLKRCVARRWAAEAAVLGWTWKRLRQTCASYLVSAHGIGWSAFLAARQLGHSVAIAEKHYLEALRGIPATARTLEAAMGVEGELSAILASASCKPGKNLTNTDRPVRAGG